MNWTASWIWGGTRATSGAGGSAPCVLFRRSFLLRHSPRTASAFCTAWRGYQLYVNGRLLGRGPAPGGPRFQPFDAYDLVPFLTRGENVVAAVCIHEGGGPVPGGFLFQATIASGEETPLELVSDGEWRVHDASGWRTASDGPWPDAWAQETCHLEWEPYHWQHPGFADAGWPRARRLGPAATPPWERLVPRQLPIVREVEHRPARVLGRDADGVCLDFGGIVVGSPRLTVAPGVNAAVEIGYGDWVDPEGRLTERPGAPLRADRIVPTDAAGSLRRARRREATVWEPLGRRAFRYCRVSPGDLRSSDLTVVTEGYPVEDRGAFHCSDPVLNDAWELGRETLRLTMQEQFEACPAWAPHETVAAARPAALANYYAFGDYRLAGRALWRLASEGGARSGDGATDDRRPTTDDRRPSTEHRAREQFLWVLMLAEYLRYSGDERLTRQLFPYVAGSLASAYATTNAHGLLESGAGETALNALFHEALLAAAGVARQLGEHSGEFEHRARAVRQAINYSLWSESERAFADGQTEEGLAPCGRESNWLALAMSAVDSLRQGVVLRRLLADRAAVLRLPPSFLLFVAEALFGLGYAEEALDLIRSVWGEMRRRGATSCWERVDWDAPRDSPPSGSLCHAASTWPTWFLPARILGVVPKAAGWSEIVFRPIPADLESAEGVIPTLSGDVRVGWRRGEGAFELSADLPAGVQADVLLPWREGQLVEWDGDAVWPTARAEPGVELDHPIERVPEGLRVRVVGPRRVVLNTRH